MCRVLWVPDGYQEHSTPTIKVNTITQSAIAWEEVAVDLMGPLLENTC